MIDGFRTIQDICTLTSPESWYPGARIIKRKIVYHGGPTNSGKTYSALQKLKASKNGLSIGPLRLLALEIYEDLTLDGIYCNLATGQEKRDVPFATHTSATIEMTPTDKEFDIVVVDEVSERSERNG